MSTPKAQKIYQYCSIIEPQVYLHKSLSHSMLNSQCSSNLSDNDEQNTPIDPLIPNSLIPIAQIPTQKAIQAQVQTQAQAQDNKKFPTNRYISTKLQQILQSLLHDIAIKDHQIEKIRASYQQQLRDQGKDMREMEGKIAALEKQNFQLREEIGKLSKQVSGKLGEIQDIRGKLREKQKQMLYGRNCKKNKYGKKDRKVGSIVSSYKSIDHMEKRMNKNKYLYCQTSLMTRLQVPSNIQQMNRSRSKSKLKSVGRIQKNYNSNPKSQKIIHQIVSNTRNQSPVRKISHTMETEIYHQAKPSQHNSNHSQTLCVSPYSIKKAHSSKDFTQGSASTGTDSGCKIQQKQKYGKKYGIKNIYNKNFSYLDLLLTKSSFLQKQKQKQQNQAGTTKNEKTSQHRPEKQINKQKQKDNQYKTNPNPNLNLNLNLNTAKQKNSYGIRKPISMYSHIY